MIGVSSSAANLYAALAAETALDDDTDELEQNPPQQLIVTTTAPRQILVSAGGQISIPQRVAVMGQHYVVAQPQTALVQVNNFFTEDKYMLMNAQIAPLSHCRAKSQIWPIVI